MHNQTHDTLFSTRSVIAAADMPSLTGSRQQIELAQSIRIDLLVAANGLLGHLHSLTREGSLLPAQYDEAYRATLRLRDTAPAAWWIAHRDRTMPEILWELQTRSYALELGEN